MSTAEWLFVKLLIIHLDNVHRAMKRGLFVTIEGLQADIRMFFSSPIPKRIWDMVKPMQNEEFILFVESALNARPTHE